MEMPPVLKPLEFSRVSRNATSADDMTPWIVVLSCWLLAGCAALICVPALRGSDPVFGWLPYWLIIAPAIDLAVLRRRSLLARTHALFARVGRRRRTARQATPLRRRVRMVRRPALPRSAAG
jgi:hypothetical protein